MWMTLHHYTHHGSDLTSIYRIIVTHAFSVFIFVARILPGLKSTQPCHIGSSIRNKAGRAFVNLSASTTTVIAVGQTFTTKHLKFIQ